MAGGKYGRGIPNGRRRITDACFENTYGLKRFGICAESCECNRCGKKLVCDKCAYLSIREEPVNCMEGGVQGCPFRVSLPEEEKKGWSRMTRKEAREMAQELVL